MDQDAQPASSPDLRHEGRLCFTGCASLEASAVLCDQEIESVGIGTQVDWKEAESLAPKHLQGI